MFFSNMVLSAAIAAIFVVLVYHGWDMAGVTTGTWFVNIEQNLLEFRCLQITRLVGGVWCFSFAMIVRLTINFASSIRNINFSASFMLRSEKERFI